MADAPALPFPDALRLRAEDSEDIAVFAACLQDALVPIEGMHYEAAERRFIVALNRFRWEKEGKGSGVRRRHERVPSGLRFEFVRAIRRRGFTQGKRDRVFELLTIACDPGPECSAAITLVFAGGAAVRIEVECIDSYLRDIGTPQPVPVKPRHSLAPRG